MCCILHYLEVMYDTVSDYFLVIPKLCICLLVYTLKDVCNICKS